MRPHLFCLKQKCTRLIDRARRHPAAGNFFDRHGFTCNHRFIYIGRALGNHAINRNSPAGPDPQQITYIHFFKLHFLLCAISLNEQRRIRSHGQQGCNGAAGFGSRT